MKRLRLDSNQIGDTGVTSLANACASGALANLETLDLRHNNIGDVGCTALASAVGEGALPALTHLKIDNNPASFEARQAAMDAINVFPWASSVSSPAATAG